MPQVIINADDFGFTDGVTSGIVRTMCEGVVTSTTAMACASGAAARLRRWAPEIPGRIGAHLQLTTGRALSNPALIPTLCGRDGNFPTSKTSLNSARTGEIVLEWDEQFQFLRRAGIEPTHIDTHHHVHKYPHVFEAFCEIARRFDVPARALTRSMSEELRHAHISCPDYTSIEFYGDGLTSDRLLALLERAIEAPDPPAVIEVMCHPGVPCEELSHLSNYVQGRRVEMEALCFPGLAKRLAERGFELVSYATL
ncbi:MAG: ChbG/HpnK family deacetylase [Acidobacteriaceae bacterium]